MAKRNRQQNPGQSTAGMEKAPWRVKKEKAKRAREDRRWADRASEVEVRQMDPEELARLRAERAERG